MAPKKQLQSHLGLATIPSTTAAELNYERTTSALDILIKEEDLRKLRCHNLILKDELDELNERLIEEGERADQAEYDADAWESTATNVTERLERTSNELRSKTREVETLKAHITSLSAVSDDSSKLLAEKLALTRDLANLQPELEHLRSQAKSNENILSEKLSLQRQLSNAQAELENEQRTLERIKLKQGMSDEQGAHYEEKIDDLTRQLAKERSEREKAQKASQRGDSDANDLTKLRKELAAEKSERAKLERQFSKASNDFEAQKAALDDRLNQFRTKLRSTKAALKEVEGELQKAREDATTNSRQFGAEPKAKNPRKRTASEMDPDAAIGTPGDGGRAKREKRASSMVGGKSTFSITPFLNRTTSMAPEDGADQQPSERDVPLPSIEVSDSPSVERSRAMSAAAAPKHPVAALAPASRDKANLKIAASGRQKAAASLTLEKVTEEADVVEGQNMENNENVEPTPAQVVEDNGKPSRLSLKPKSLASFASFREGSLPPQQLQKKKRKILGTVGKTLFDDGEDESEPGKTAFGGQRAFGAFGVGGFKGMSLLKGKKKGPAVVAEDGFMFSPLKKDKKAMAARATTANKGTGDLPH